MSYIAILLYRFFFWSIGALRRASTSLFTACLASYAASRRLPLRVCLPESRATHCPQNMVVPGLIFSSGAKVALRLLCAQTRSVPLLAAPPETPASVEPPAVHRHVAKAKTAVTPICLHLSADPAADTPDYDLGRLE